MIRFHAFGIHFALPLLTLIVPSLASHLGMHGSAAPLVLALLVHELAHIVAAKLLRVEIIEIRLMPFGGSARMENPYNLPPGRIIPIAAAGPFANLVLALVFSSLAQWNLLAADNAALYTQPNLILCLFNLLPVLPLDGGRMLFALFSGITGHERALQIGIRLGRLLSAILLLLALLGGLRHGIWNLALILAAIFIIASERDERSALAQSRAQKLMRMLSDDPQPQPARLYHLDGSTQLRCALKLIRHRESAWFVITYRGLPESIVDGHSILDYLIKNNAPDTRLGDLPCRRHLPERISGTSKAPVNL